MAASAVDPLRVVDRRWFLRVSVIAGLAVACPLRSLVATPSAAGRQQRSGRGVELRLGLLTDAASPPDLLRGYELGVAEAERAADLFGGRIDSLIAASISSLTGCSVVVGAVARGRAAAAAQRDASNGGTVYLNAAAGTDSLRSADCGALAFHVIPSEGMRRVAGSGSRPVAWSPRLTRFGAEQLNDRYRHRFSSDMTEAAWCGWIAVKIGWEAALRARSTRAADIASLLLQATGFDGHKGRALRFGSADRQLRQPLYSPSDLREFVPGVEQTQAVHGSGQCGR